MSLEMRMKFPRRSFESYREMVRGWAEELNIYSRREEVFIYFLIVLTGHKSAVCLL